MKGMLEIGHKECSFATIEPIFSGSNCLGKSFISDEAKNKKSSDDSNFSQTDF